MYLMSNAPECIGPSAPTCKTEHTHVKQGLHLKTNKTPKLINKQIKPLNYQLLLHKPTT